MKWYAAKAGMRTFQSYATLFFRGAALPLYMLVLFVGLQPIAVASATEVMVYKDPQCGCCNDWVKHLQDAGFTVTSEERNDMQAIKAQYSVLSSFASCHTAIVDGYVVEGHVPAEDVQRLLKERPNIVGLTAPGMPMHSPGMQPAGKPPKHYDVLGFDKQGKTFVFSHY